MKYCPKSEICLMCQLSKRFGKISLENHNTGIVYIIRLLILFLLLLLFLLFRYSSFFNLSGGKNKLLLDQKVSNALAYL